MGKANKAESVLYLTVFILIKRLFQYLFHFQKSLIKHVTQSKEN